MAITIHYFNKDLNLITKLIGMENIDNIHSGENLNNILIECLKSYNILDNIIW